MHTFQGESCTIHFNSDMSGEINIYQADAKISVLGSDILEFVAEYIRGQRIANIESMDWKNFIK